MGGGIGPSIWARDRSNAISTELKILAWTILLAVVHILLTASFRTRETGLAYNAGARDSGGPPVGVVTARMQRAQANLFETLPLFVAAVLIAHVAGRESGQTLAGCWLYILARIAYVPLYALGIPFVRSLVWVASLLGLLLVILASL
jgi:uncharacterized MAPEG superfamily protein